MVWLDGKPKLIKTLAWPADDPDLHQQGRKREGWSLLDDRILFWRAFLSSERPSTLIYMVNTASARNIPSEITYLERVAKLDYVAHRIAIVSGVGFVSAQWRGSDVYFRAHSETGELLRECPCPAMASYGVLCVLGSTVSLCVTSNTVSPEWEGVPSDIHFQRLDFHGNNIRGLPNDLAADSIAHWDAESGVLRMVKIPQTRLNRITHSAEFQFINPHTIVLASSLAFGSPGALLSVFSTKAEDGEKPLNFYHGVHTERQMITNWLGQTSASTPGSIIVHDHNCEGRITVFKSELLSGHIPSSATTRDPDGMREPFNYPNAARTLGFRAIRGLSSVCDTRILVNRQDRLGETRVFVLDFNQSLLPLLLAKDPSERAEWNAQLVDEHAQIKIVTRRFYHSIVEGEFDQEYPWPQRAPPEWEAHLMTLDKSDDEDEEWSDDDDDDESNDGDYGVEYDEAPEEHRNPIPFGFVQTALRLEGVNESMLSITRHAIIEIPGPTSNGRIFYFD
ncbi:hypothetical protein H0H92_008421 [Tricholoma furcatifolium]|nr:hypothetical protein H0H92_008421 [Tricholoma furcatifolium]